MYGRVPGTLAAALTQAAAILGTEKLGEVAGVGLSMAQKWINPTKDNAPAVHQCLQIDKACLAAANTAPIHEFYHQEIGRPKLALPQTQDLQREMLDVTRATGQLAEKVLEATSAQSASGKDLSPNERIIILREVENTETELRDIRLLAEARNTKTEH